MDDGLTTSFWERFQRTSGFTGGAALLLIFFASALDQRFDWRVFLLSSGALFLVLARMWILVPVHMRHERAEEAMTRRYNDSDWLFVDALSELSGLQIDALRAVFRSGNDAAARTTIQEHWPQFSVEQVQGFLRFFSEDFEDDLDTYLDEDGRLQPFD